MPEGFEIDVSAAAEALNDIGGFSAAQNAEVHGGVGPDQNATVTPNEGTTNEGTTTPAETTPAAEPVVAETGQDTILPRADLDALLAGVTDPAARAAVETAYKSFQGGFTKKAQELAEQRKQFEALGPLDAVQEAIELRNALQDPRQWQSLHEELSAGLRAMGMSPSEADAAASQTLAEEAEPTLPDLSALEDPELSPFKEHINKLHEELAGIKSEWAKEREAENLRQVQTAMIGELQRQENILRENHPDLKDEDITGVWEMSSFYDGNLLQAHQALEAYARRRFEAYLEKKQSVATGGAAVPAPVAGAATLTESPTYPVNLDQAHNAALERLRMIETQG